MAKVTKLCYGGEAANTYVYGEEGGPCLIFDLGHNASHCVEEYCRKHHSAILGLFLTHGHFDHILGINDLEFPQKFPIFLSPYDERCLADGKFNGSVDLMGQGISIDPKFSFYPVEDQDEIKIGPFLVKVIETPFHTSGSVCFLIEEDKTLFSGDTLFHNGIGRFDLPGAEPRAMEASLRKLAALDEDIMVYPGHGPKTTIGDEKRRNPYLRSVL